jgi:hypothetical protein
MDLCCAIPKWMESTISHTSYPFMRSQSLMHDSSQLSHSLDGSRISSADHRPSIMPYWLKQRPSITGESQLTAPASAPSMSKSCKPTATSTKPKTSNSHSGWSVKSVKLVLKHAMSPQAWGILRVSHRQAPATADASKLWMPLPDTFDPSMEM